MTKAKLGLTLIELMAILVVVLVIAAILFPVTACACGSPGTACMNNLKQSGLAALMYADDYDNHLPKAAVWVDRLAPYAKREGVFQDVEGIKKGAYGYAFRKSASSTDQSEIKVPAQFMLLFDSSLMGRNATSELWSLPRPGRHKGGDNVCFADGHVKRFWLGDASKPEEVSPMQKALLADDNAGPGAKKSER